MKKALFTLVIVCLPLIAFGQKDDNAITMVSYEQSWLDTQGTLALKNNTDVEIRNIVFMITYLDMSGNELDYEDFSKIVTIAPGMTKKVDIPAYEHERSYHYYKSENSPMGSSAFKIKFLLKDFNTQQKSSDSSINNTFHELEQEYNTNKSRDYLYIYLIVGILFLLSIGISIGIYVIIALMAQDRNRSAVLWILLSFIASPLLVIIILLCIGKDERGNKNYIT